jgi:hypothetical protein
VSKVENHSHKRAHGTAQIGEAHPGARLTSGQAAEIRCRFRAGEGATALGREFGVHESTARDIGQGRLWKCLSDPYRGEGQ